MAKTTEFSEDGGNWTKHPTGEDAYERNLIDFESDWSKDLIQTYLVPQAKVEFSQDGGYSWTPFRFSQDQEENAARIYTMLQRNYQVRRVVTKQLRQTKVTDVANSTFFRAANKANNKLPKISTENVYVYRRASGQYSFSYVDLKTMKAAFNDVELICTVRQRTVYDMSTPNENEVIYSPAGEVRNKDQMRVRGYVFRFTPFDKVPSVQHWEPILKGSNAGFNAADYVVVKSARLYDIDMDPFFEGLGPLVSVMGTKYILGWRNRLKFGDTWLIDKNLQPAAEQRIRAKGGFVEVPGNEVAQVENRKEEVSFDDKEVNPTYIMGIRTNFEEIVRIGSDQQIMDNLIKVIDFRNKCVDELKELNKVIEEARLKIKANVAHG